MSSSNLSERAETPHRIEVAVGGRSCDVLVGPGLTGDIGLHLDRAGFGPDGAIITDKNVARYHLVPLIEALARGNRRPAVIEIPAGEASKSFARLEQAVRAMTSAGLDRHSWLLALGGGVIGDLGGFAAAVYQRGIRLIQLPTTIVSQVDSSVGGKTGINLPEGKNLVGSFHQPDLVLADTSTLSTLPEREWNEGFAEVIKHAAIRDGAMLDLLPPQRHDAASMAELVARNVTIKARIVEQDERETSGTRALLNFGHTIGHGIEAAGGYGRFLHGEAIALGLVAACNLSERNAGLDPAVSRSIRAALEAFGLPSRLPDDIDPAAIMEAIARDKKFHAGQVRFVLLRELGDAFVSGDLDSADVAAAIDELMS